MLYMMIKNKDLNITHSIYKECGFTDEEINTKKLKLKLKLILYN